MINQVETHVFNQQVKVQEIMEKYGTRIMSWGLSPKDGTTCSRILC